MMFSKSEINRIFPEFGFNNLLYLFVTFERQIKYDSNGTRGPNMKEEEKWEVLSKFGAVQDLMVVETYKNNDNPAHFLKTAQPQ